MCIRDRTKIEKIGMEEENMTGSHSAQKIKKVQLWRR